MKEITLRLLLVGMMLPLIWGSTTSRSEPERSSNEFGCKYWDGEGNKISNEAVRLLVRSQFVIMDSSEMDTLQKYFYNLVTRHSCPFELCPMQGQLVFTTECEEGSDCYYLDWIHWEHPTWSYDECEDYLFLPTKWNDTCPSVPIP